MVHLRVSLIALSLALLSPIAAVAGSVLIMEAPQGAPGSVFHRAFFSELGLVLERDELYRKIDDNGVFFAASIEEKIAAAGRFCDSGASMSVVWVDADESGVHRLGLVVDTPSGKVGRVVAFDKTTSVAEVALVAGGLLEHGRRFAETSVARADGWIIVESPDRTVGPAAPNRYRYGAGVMDTERPWESSGVSVEVPIGAGDSRFSFGIAYEFVQSISAHVGPGMWMGQTLHGTFRPVSDLLLSVTFSTFGSVFPNKDGVTVRGVQLVPRFRLGYVVFRGGVGMLIGVSGGAVNSKLRITNDSLRNREISTWDGALVAEVLMMFPSDGPVAVHLGPVVTARFPERIVKLSADEDSAVNETIYYTAMFYFGAKLGVTVFL